MLLVTNETKRLLDFYNCAVLSAEPAVSRDLVLKARGAKFIRELKPVTDPQRRQGFPARDPNYRLKLVLKRLLRDYGLECTSVSDSQGEPIDSTSPTEDD